MLTALLLLSIQGQFFSQACKQNGDCNLDDLTVAGTLTFGNFVARDGGSFSGDITADNFIARDGGVFGGAISASSVLSSGYFSSSTATNNVAFCSPNNGSNISYSFERGSQDLYLNVRTASTGTVCNGSSSLALTVSPTTATINSPANYAITTGGKMTAGNFIAADGGTFGGSINVANFATVGNIIANDGGVFKKVTIEQVDIGAFGDCTTQAGTFRTWLGATGGAMLQYCDGLFWSRVPTYSRGAAGVEFYRAPMGRIVSRTIASGVITTGNNLVGSGKISYVTGSGANGNSNFIDSVVVQCATAGTGAGNAVVDFRLLTGAGASECTVNYPCASVALAPITLSCTGSLVSTPSEFDDSAYGTRIDVSGCTTPPADCEVSHDIYTN